MAQTPKNRKQGETNSIPQMPFNEALKRVWASKPKHKTTKKLPEAKKK